MSNDDINIKILEKMNDISVQAAKMEVELKSIKEDIQEIKREDAIQNQLLAEHIAGVETQRQRLDIEIKNRELLLQKHEDASQNRFVELDKRLKEIEFFPTFLQSLKRVAIWIAAIAGAVVAFLEILKFW